MNKEKYTKDQIQRVIKNMATILEITEPYLENKTMELIYVHANDSICRLEGIIHYSDELE
ncbi:MAG: hypothetical protein BZ138_07965 [Methanosphaera sp. rholeuAM270]|nr:MAG: hypothetical protein BZ138_07965 [Methanosphaera sp. rholeuAM270]